MRYVRRGMHLHRPTSGSIQIVYSVPIGRNERLLLVQVAGQQFLVAAGGGHINMLHVFDGKVVEEDVVAADALDNRFE